LLHHMPVCPKDTHSTRGLARLFVWPLRPMASAPGSDAPSDCAPCSATEPVGPGGRYLARSSALTAHAPPAQSPLARDRPLAWLRAGLGAHLCLMPHLCSRLPVPPCATCIRNCLPQQLAWTLASAHHVASPILGTSRLGKGAKSWSSITIQIRRTLSVLTRCHQRICPPGLGTRTEPNEGWAVPAHARFTCNLIPAAWEPARCAAIATSRW